MKLSEICAVHKHKWVNKLTFLYVKPSRIIVRHIVANEITLPVTSRNQSIYSSINNSGFVITMLLTRALSRSYVGRKVVERTFLYKTIIAAFITICRFTISYSHESTLGLPFLLVGLTSLVFSYKALMFETKRFETNKLRAVSSIEEPQMYRW